MMNFTFFNAEIDQNWKLKIENWNFFQNIWFLHHSKVFNERISEWAYFLNLAKRFRRLVLQKGAFLDKT